MMATVGVQFRPEISNLSEGDFDRIEQEGMRGCNFCKDGGSIHSTNQVPAKYSPKEMYQNTIITKFRI